MKLFKKGDKVWLPADDENPDEIGTVLEFDKKNGVYGIQLDKKYIVDKGDDGIREVETDLPKPASQFKSNKSTNNSKTTKVMAKSTKKTGKQKNDETAKAAKKRTDDRPSVKAAKKAKNEVAKKAKATRPIDAGLTRGEAAEKLKISIYAVDQLLAKKQLKSLAEAEVMKFKKSAK